MLSNPQQSPILLLLLQLGEVAVDYCAEGMLGRAGVGYVLLECYQIFCVDCLMEALQILPALPILLLLLLLLLLVGVHYCGYLVFRRVYMQYDICMLSL